MNKIRPSSVALTFGIALALFHAVWALLIWLGLAQMMMDFILSLHMIKPFFVVDSFDITRAISLVILTGVIGYVSGWILALIWNRCMKK